MDYKQEAKQARRKVLEMIYKAQTSHIGSNFSVIDILTVLYEKVYIEKENWENRDRIVLSKGWAAASLYYFLERKGLITKEDLESYCQPGSHFIGLAEPISPGIEFAGGSMGHGLPAGVGMALAAKRLGRKNKVYIVMSDGELQCGTTYESALIAKQNNLNNLVVIVDVNKWQAMGRTKDILEVGPSAFPGWDGIKVDGHKHRAIEEALRVKRENPNSPLVIWADTIKGKGVSFMEDKLIYHYKNIDEAEYKLALNELS